MIKVVLIALFVLSLECYDEYPSWEEYSQEKYGAGTLRRLSSSYRSGREYVYRRNLNEIMMNNANPNRPYKMAVNDFTDMTKAEWGQRYLTKLVVKSPEQSSGLKGSPPLSARKKSKNWRKKVTAVRDQGSCGSCWAFAASAAMQSAYIIAQPSKYNKKNIKISEQQQVDCVSASYGCQGGWMHDSFEHAVKYGLTNRNAYRYTGRDQQCKKMGGEFKLANYWYDRSSCTTVLNNLYKQPVTVAVNADRWFNVGDQIFPYESRNSEYDLNHAVLLVRFQKKNKKNPVAFWEIKNSWGKKWGRKGYMRLAYGNDGNNAGICRAAPYPIAPTE